MHSRRERLLVEAAERLLQRADGRLLDDGVAERVTRLVDVAMAYECRAALPSGERAAALRQGRDPGPDRRVADAAP